MKNIVALLGDYWHPFEDIKAGLETAVNGIQNDNEIHINFVQQDDLMDALSKQPDLLIIYKENRFNPQDTDIVKWMTDHAEATIINYVELGGSIIAWHTGMAEYEPDSKYVGMLRGYFKYHPPGLQHVTYSVSKEDDSSITESFELKDEQYFVQCHTENTKVYLTSKGVDGDSIAGWQHMYGEGKVCCFTPAHTREGMLDTNVSRLLMEKIVWCLSK